MTKRKNIVIIALTVLVFAGILAQVRGFGYDPTFDYNNDGAVDIRDLFAFSQVYGTFRGTYAPQSLSLTLIIQEIRVEAVPGRTFTLWSYNGTVPGPTIWANVGDTVDITLRNPHNLKHSLHVHGFSYNITSDGSQGDPGYSDRGIIGTNQEYTYRFKADRPGLYAYHCHSDDGYPISVHIQQGLYGAIVVSNPNNPLTTPDKQYFVFLNEVYGQLSLSMAHGCAYCFGQTKYFTINARQWPLSPTFTALPGELVRFYVINLGNDIHSFHVHDHAMYRWEIINGQWASVLVQNDNAGFVPLEASIIDVEAQTPGKWLYHCHVEPHADEGMMGIFEIQGERPLQSTQIHAPQNLLYKTTADLQSIGEPESSSSNCSQTSDCPTTPDCPDM